MTARDFDKAVEIYTNFGDFYKPHFMVTQQNSPLGAEVIRDVLQVTYRDGLKQFDSFELTINNEWNLAQHSFRYSDEAIFDPGNALELWMGYLGENTLRLMLKGEITSLRPGFPASGTSTLSVSAHNILHRFRVKQASQTYNEQKDSQIAQQVVQRLKADLNINLDLKLDSNAQAEETKHPHIVQDNEYDILFLMGRAQRAGYDLFVEEVANGKSKAGIPQLYFGPSAGVRRATYKLTYGKSLMDFRPTLTTANQVSKVIIRSWDNVHKRPIEVTITRHESDVNRSVGDVDGRSAIARSIEHRQEIVVDKPVMSEAEARQLGKATLENIMKSIMKGSGTTIGLPDLRAGSIIFLEGLGQRFSGRYFVTATTHTINESGYTTQFECERQEV